MNEKKQSKLNIERLVSFFLKFKFKRPQQGETDYSRWNQTEEEYQQEQNEWLKKIRQKKKRQK